MILTLQGLGNKYMWCWQNKGEREIKNWAMPSTCTNYSECNLYELWTWTNKTWKRSILSFQSSTILVYKNHTIPGIFSACWSIKYIFFLYFQLINTFHAFPPAWRPHHHFCVFPFLYFYWSTPSSMETLMSNPIPMNFYSTCC